MTLISAAAAEETETAATTGLVLRTGVNGKSIDVAASGLQLVDGITLPS